MDQYYDLSFFFLRIKSEYAKYDFIKRGKPNSGMSKCTEAHS